MRCAPWSAVRGGVLLGALLTLAAVGVSPASAATITAAYPAWSPNSATITAGESVTFESNESLAHGVGWEPAAPATPSCTGVPGPAQAGPWSGSCTFTVAGSYPFVCTLHASMTGTITVNSAGPGAPVVSTSAATSVTDTGATLKGSVNPNGLATEYFFKYGTTAAYGQETGKTSVSAGTSPVTASTGVTGLTAATTYHFRLFAENSSGTSQGSDLTFTTAGPPTATTEPAAGVGGTLATLAGVINPKGLETKYFFNYGETVAYGQKTTEKVAGSGTSNVSKTEALSGLSLETTYHFQLVAKNSAGETKGVDRTFTTFGPPLATTGEAVGVGDAGATLQGLVDAQGQETSYYFNYGPTSAYGQKTATKSAGKGTTNASVSAPLTGLSPETTYHFQLVAESGAGTATGADHAFTTSGTPPPPPPPPAPAPPPPVLDPPPLAPSPTVRAAPNTKFTRKPPARTKDRTPTFKFKVDGRPGHLQMQARRQGAEAVPIAADHEEALLRPPHAQGQRRCRRPQGPDAGEVQVPGPAATLGAGPRVSGPGSGSLRRSGGRCRWRGRGRRA